MVGYCFLCPSRNSVIVAHHAFDTEFDAKKPVTKRGIVTKVEWTNPHVWFYLNVKNDKGEVENWGFEMGGPNGLQREGWTRNTIVIGSELSSTASWLATAARTSTRRS